MAERAREILFSTLIVVISLLLLEGVLHLFVKPSWAGYGIFFGQDLPPLRVVQDVNFSNDQADRIWHRARVGNPLNLSNGDLWGVFREDEDLGYVYAENRVSLRGWWRSNNIGASGTTPTAPRARGKKRLFIFGESFGRGSRVRQEEAWSSLIQKRHPRDELVNLAVDGYSMGQAYRRFETVRARYDFDTALFLFVPEADLWREINTMRFLGEGWYAFTILPRYVLEGERLRWVRGPYAIGSEIYHHDLPELTPRVREHLRRYDRFYFPALYESPPLLGNFLAYKMIARTIGETERAAIYQRARSRVDGEAMAIVRRLFQSADRSLRAQGKRLVVTLLPGPELIETLRADPNSAERRWWDERVQELAREGLSIVDLLPAMQRLPAADLDRGYDRTHYGPRANRAIAEALEAELSRLGVL